LSGGPDFAVAAQESGPGAFLAAEAERTVQEASREPLEADRHLVQLAAQPCCDTVDQAGADHRLADCGMRVPRRPVFE